MFSWMKKILDSKSASSEDKIQSASLYGDQVKLLKEDFDIEAKNNFEFKLNEDEENEIKSLISESLQIKNEFHHLMKTFQDENELQSVQRFMSLYDLGDFPMLDLYLERARDIFDESLESDYDYFKNKYYPQSMTQVFKTSALKRVNAYAMRRFNCFSDLLKVFDEIKDIGSFSEDVYDLKIDIQDLNIKRLSYYETEDLHDWSILLLIYRILSPDYFVISNSGLSEIVYRSNEILSDFRFNEENRIEEARIEFNQIHDIVSKYIDVLRKRYKILCFKDEYDIVDESKFIKELEYFTKNRIPTCKHHDPIHVALFLVKEDLEHCSGNFDEVNVSELSPIEFEHHCSGLLEKFGWKAYVTKGSGDQGIDIVAEKNDVKVILQCKLYSSPVGNKAVQEAISGKVFADALYAVVVTNNSFTPSAKQLANTSGVKLIHHSELSELDKLLGIV